MLCWWSLNTGREKPLVVIFFFSPLFGSEAFGHVSVFSSYQYCFQMLSWCFFLVCVWVVAWSLALRFWEESLWLGSEQTWTQATIVWPQLPLFEVVFGFKMLVWPMASETQPQSAFLDSEVDFTSDPRLHNLLLHLDYMQSQLLLLKI